MCRFVPLRVPNVNLNEILRGLKKGYKKKMIFATPTDS